MLAQMNGQTPVQVQYPLPGGGLAIYTGSTPTYARPDWLGGSRLMTSSTQTMLHDSAYAPFGEQYSTRNIGTSGFYDFTGQQQWTVSGSSAALDDFPFRKYHPVQGRWISPDPAGMAAVDTTNPQTWNRYAYVMNNPLSNVDPLGLKCGVFEDQPIGCGGFGDDFGGSYDTSAGANYDAAGNFLGWAPGGVAWFGAIAGGVPTGAPGDGFNLCGAYCAPPPSLLGNITASQEAFGEQMYETWEIGALQDLAQQAAANNAAQLANCQADILNAVNSQFGTSFTSANVGTGTSAPFQSSTGAPSGEGTLNIDIFPGPGQGDGISPGYYPVNGWSYVIGYGSTLHVVAGPGGVDSSSTLYFSSNGFTAHLDSAYPYNPIGAVFHWALNMAGVGGYKPCP